MNRTTRHSDAGIRPCLGGAMLLVLVTMVVTQTAAARPDAPTIDRPGGRPQAIDRSVRAANPEGTVAGVRRSESERPSGGEALMCGRWSVRASAAEICRPIELATADRPRTSARSWVRQGLAGLAPPVVAGA